MAGMSFIPPWRGSDIRPCYSFGTFSLNIENNIWLLISFHGENTIQNLQYEVLGLSNFTKLDIYT